MTFEKKYSFNGTIPMLVCHYPEDELLILRLLKTDILYYASCEKMTSHITWDNGKDYGLQNTLGDFPYVYFDWRGKPKEILKIIIEGL